MPDRNPPPADLSKLKLHSVSQRPHLVDVARFPSLTGPGATVSDWLDALPDFLGARNLRGAIDAILTARRADRPVVFATGAHFIKVGCGPIVADLIRRGVVTAIAANGAMAIHDVEVAMLGATSEDVAEAIRDGSFGMVRETMDFFAEAARGGAANQTGLGRAVGALIRERKLPHAHLSVLAAADELDVPACIHVALGTDTIHMAPNLRAEELGAASMTDFRRLCAVVAELGAATTNGPGGVWCNIGSAVIMPEVFLKAVAVARNLGHNLDAMNTVNLDMFRHYRPQQNVLTRPVTRGRSFDLVGQHEIQLPLLRQAIIDKLS
jgi:hypothetical protein